VAKKGDFFDIKSSTSEAQRMSTQAEGT